EWLLTLDAEARFQDDAPVTAEDAVRSLRDFLASDSPAGRRLGALLAPGGVLAPDPAHLALRFREPVAAPLAPLAAAWITGPRGAGAGPFIPTHEVPGSRLALTAFASHVRGRPYLDRVALVASSDEDRLRADLALRQVDVAVNAPGVSRLAGTLLLVLDSRQAAVATLEARSAIAAAIDADAIVKRFLPGAVASPSLLAHGGSAPAAAGPRARPRALTGTLALAVSTEVPQLVSQR